MADTVLALLFSSTTEGTLKGLGFVQDPDWFTADGSPMKVQQSSVKSELAANTAGTTATPTTCMAVLTYGLDPASDTTSSDTFITSVKYKQASAQIGGGDIEYRARVFTDDAAAADFMTKQAALRKSCASFTATLPDGTSGTINTAISDVDGDSSFNDHTEMPGVTYSNTGGIYSNVSYLVRDGNLVVVVGTSGDANAGAKSATIIQGVLTNAITNGPGATTTGSFGSVAQTDGCAWLTKEDVMPSVGNAPVSYVTSGHAGLVDDCEWDDETSDAQDATKLQGVIYQVHYETSLDSAKSYFASLSADSEDETDTTGTLGVGDESHIATSTSNVGSNSRSIVRFGHYVSVLIAINPLQDGATACIDLQQEIGEHLK